MAEPTLIERLTELANQLGGHAGPSDTVELSEFLTKCEKEAFAIATELHRLERHSLPGGAAGYRLVPEEPTEAMLAAGEGMSDLVMPDGLDNSEAARRSEIADAWRAMVQVASGEQVRGVLKPLAASPPPSVWMDIDTAPNTAAPVLCCNATTGDIEVSQATDHSWRRGFRHRNGFPATHYMPIPALPPPPQQEGK